MNFLKNEEIVYFLITLFLISLNIQIINSQNLCPYTQLPDLLKYYQKGINPSLNEETDDQYKWEYIHCVNNYFKSPYLPNDLKDAYLIDNTGVLIGSSINIGKLNKDFIRTNLTQLNPNDIKNLVNLTGAFGKEAKSKMSKITFNFTEDEIKHINEKVYAHYLIEMRQFFELDKSDIEYSFELNLLAFYVKYYGMDKYLNQAKDCLKSQKEKLYFLLSYFFLNLKNENYTQRKLRSMVALSCDMNYYTNNISHIGIYYDTKLDSNYEGKFKMFLLSFVEIFNFENYFYSMGHYNKLITDHPCKENDFSEIIEGNSFSFKYPVSENITRGIEHLKEALNEPIVQENIYYQKHLLIFINDINSISEEINTDYFFKNGIQVILMAKINQKSDEEKLKKIFNDEFNIITFYNYTELAQKKEYLMLLKNLINFNIQNYFYGENTHHINISNIKTFGKNNMRNFKIIFDSKLTPPSNITTYYFYISLIYNNAKEIESKYNNNANLTFLLSGNNPYPDIVNKDIINFCFNKTVSSDPSLSPFINYKINDTNNYFYIAIINANDINYSLKIVLKSSSDDIQDSNGVFGKNNIYPKPDEFIATFNGECIQKKCGVDYASFLKYFSSGVHYSKALDPFNKIIDMNMIGCLYKNIFCTFFEMEKSETKFENGPMIGYGLNLSNVTSIKFFNESIPLYLINKLYPFLAEVIDMSEARKTLNDNNLKLTSEEIDMINKYYLSNIYKNLETNHKKFLELNDNLKLSIFLRVLEQHSTPDSIDSYLTYLTSNNIDKYIRSLKDLQVGRMVNSETKDFQMMITQTKNILQPKKCLLSLVIGKSLLWSDEFFELVGKLSNYRMSISYYDSENKNAELLEDFNEDIDEIKKKIYEFRNNNDKQKTEKVNINVILEQQIELFKYYDEGIKKCIVIISTRDDDEIYYRYEFNKPKKELLEELYNSGITIFDYSDHINFILEDEDDSNLGFFNSTKSEYIQFVPFLNFSDMDKNTLTLTNIINRFPIPINKLQDIYLDMEREEEIFYEFNLNNEINKLKEKNYFDKYKNLKLTFNIPGLKIYFSDKFIFPNNYSNNGNFSITKDNKEASYDLSQLNDYKFYMTIKTENRIDNSAVYLDICDNNDCLKGDFYFKFYIGFIIVGIFVFFYGIYICFCENSFKKEGNIFKIK